MFQKKFKIALLAGLTLATFFSSCSSDGEVEEKQGPQSKIDETLKQKLTETIGGSETAMRFQQQINWYQTAVPTACGVTEMLLAYQVFNADGVSLNDYVIMPWSILFGPVSDLVNETSANLTIEYGQEVTLVFVSGILIKEDASFAQIDSYTQFSEYFNDCESSQVVFQPQNGTTDWSSFLPAPDEVDEVVFPEPTCWSLVFPLQILVVNDLPNAEPFTVTVSENEFLEYMVEESTNLIVLDFAYPVTIASNENTQITVNNIEELEQVFSQPCE